MALLRGGGPPARLRELTSALGTLLVASVCSSFLLNAPVDAVKLLSASSGEAGTFLNAVILARTPLFLFQAVQAALLPRLAGLAAHDRHAEFEALLRRLLAAVAAVIAGAGAGALLLGPAVLDIVFRSRLQGSDLAVLALGSETVMLTIALTQALIALRHRALAATSWAIGAAMLLAAILLGHGVAPRVEVALVAGSAGSAVCAGVLVLLTLRPTGHGRRPG
jgi:O-antigen/teichoic acid export membrane protein